MAQPLLGLAPSRDSEDCRDLPDAEAPGAVTLHDQRFFRRDVKITPRAAKFRVKRRWDLESNRSHVAIYSITPAQTMNIP